ncbi:Phosphoserine aminotransferase [Lobulomyces angularis]|nr:Phosphoserine aminotransferase [Lobulomyces angularis]
MQSHNFSAGPAVLPKSVLETAQRELLNFANTGSSVLEISHRSKEFEQVNQEAQQNLKDLLDVPDDYAILFMQGGASAQFSSIYLNLLVNQSKPVDYIVTGIWSEKALKEAKKLGGNCNVVFNLNNSKDKKLPIDDKDWNFSKDSSYIFYVSNETVHGIELNDHEDKFFEKFPKDKVLVCDMSSNILSRKVDVKKFGCIFFGVQKNIGPAGLTVVVIKKELIGTRQDKNVPVPSMLCYKTCYDANSMYNTPPTFSVYLSNLVFKNLKELGGISYMEKLNLEKSNLIYGIIDKRKDVFQCPVEVSLRSRMNIVWRCLGSDGKPSNIVEKEFFDGAERLRLHQLQGHRVVGGVRASLYNAIPMESVLCLADYMNNFKP